jgi:hypothetical protein
MLRRTLPALVLLGCGARTGLQQPDAGWDVPRANVFDVIDGSTPDVTDAVTPRDRPDAVDACVPVRDRCGDVERCGDGADDDCDGQVDEGCTCVAGSVQPCFAGPPGRRGVGVCRDGTQVCLGSGAWGACLGGISPRADVCNGADNLCDGCSAQSDCEIQCPSPGDPRTPDALPLRAYPLRGTLFYPGVARRWAWSVEGGPCDRLSRRPSFTLAGADAADAVFTPRLSGDYRVTLAVTTLNNRELRCQWVVHAAGPGLRVEMCYPENESIDLDLFVHRPNNRDAWYPLGENVFRPTPNACGWHNCEASIRGTDASGAPVPRADWGYGASALSECVDGPQGDAWRALGQCANPRLDIDNNLSKATGLPENINIDRPRDGETFRVMVHNFTGTLARPLVNVYCDGRRVATYGEAPDLVARFAGDTNPRVGAMWRVADVTTRVRGGATTCEVTALHPAGTTRGYDVTYNDPRY